MSDSARLRGIIPPMVTPFAADETLDEAALQREVRWLIEEARVHGLAVGGSTGEGHTLGTDELRCCAGAALDAAAGRVPVIAGVIVDSTRQALEKGSGARRPGTGCPAGHARALPLPSR